MEYLHQQKKIEFADQELKSKLLNIYIRDVIQVKTKPREFAMVNTKALMGQLSHQEFSELLLPAIKKSLLRSPELILAAVAQMCAGLNLDLSAYMSDLSKPLTSMLYPDLNHNHW